MTALALLLGGLPPQTLGPSAPAPGGDSFWFWRLDDRTLQCRDYVSPATDSELWVIYQTGDTRTGGRYYLWSVGRPPWTREPKLYFGYINGRQYVQLVTGSKRRW